MAYKREKTKEHCIFLLLATLIAVVYLLKNKMNDDEDFDEDWDTDWDDFDENDCCCTDKDVDTSVKVEKL